MRRSHLGDGLKGRAAKDVSDDLQLVDHVLARKNGAPQQELGKDAANGPAGRDKRCLLRSSRLWMLAVGMV